MEFISISDDKLVNLDNITSIEKRKGNFTITTTDGKQHIVEYDIAKVLAELLRAGINTPKQFWAG